jgi:nicotinate-nucleotide--dimethylbenzimidazole phosphoribosyltransferase
LKNNKNHLSNLMQQIQVTALSTTYKNQIQNKIDQKTKPLGSLGQLEHLASQLAAIQSQQQGSLVNNITISNPTVVVFAGDHGISEQGVSIAPSAVTRQMVLNFLAGGAAINCFCRSNNIDFKVVDAGIIKAIDGALGEAADGQIEQHHKNLITQRLGAGTKDFSHQSAMTAAQVEQGLFYGEQAIAVLLNNNCNVLMLGEMGIGNTSSAAAILSALTKAPVEKCVGIGTGINPEQLALKKQLITQALARFDSSDPKIILKEVGGFEIVQMTGAIIAAAQAGICILIDGFIVSTAALLAVNMAPNVRDYLIFAHQSAESGHQLLLEKLTAKPLLNLGLRLGEGTGAALALPLLNAAACFYNDMASFESAGVTV